MFENHAIPVLIIHNSFCLRLLSLHDGVKVEVLTATDRNAGQPFKNIYPQFSYLSGLPLLTKWEVSSLLLIKSLLLRSKASNRRRNFMESVLEWRCLSCTNLRYLAVYLTRKRTERRLNKRERRLSALLIKWSIIASQISNVVGYCICSILMRLHRVTITFHLEQKYINHLKRFTHDCIVSHLKSATNNDSASLSASLPA